GLPAGHRAGCPGARLRSALVPWYAAAREAVRQLLQPAGPRRLVWLRDSLLPCARPRVDGAMAGRSGRRPFGGRRLAVGFVGFLVSAMLAAGFYSLTIARSPESVARFEALLGGTSTDHDYQVRLIRWKHAWRLAAQEPLGHGLGTVGEVAGRQRNRFQIAPYLDSSYLKIALEQGIPLMVLFAAALVVLLLGLAWRGVNTPDPITGAIAIGACGTIVAMATVFYSSMYIERIAALGGWLIVGVAAAQFTRPRGRERRPQKLRSAAPTRAPRGMPRVSPRLGAPS